MDRDEGIARLRELGFGAEGAETLWLHFDDAEQRGKPSHGHARISWLESQSFDALAEPRLVEDYEGFQRWDGNGAVGYLVLGRAVTEQIANPPEHARVVVCERTFPTGMLGHHVRRLADAGLVGLLTATSPPRLGPPDGPKLAGTNPLAVAVPGGVVTDVSMGAITWGDVLAGFATEDELVPFGGEQWHKGLALALGLQLFVDALVREPAHGAVLVVARPESDPVPALRGLGVRLPGDA